MKDSRSAPLGIFDSGIGGLTVAKAIREALPHEQIIYFGDTAHLPYGDKSEAAIQAYSIKIANVLLEKGCKAIIIACNSASSAAYELLKEYVRKEAHIINVIDPMVSHIRKNYLHKIVGIIGTKRTITSDIYTTKLKGEPLKLRTLATPLLAPMIEEGFFNNQISHGIIGQYLGSPELSHIDALVLACTHYPLIKNEIRDFYHGKVTILDSSQLVAESLRQLLMENDLMNQKKVADDHFYVSDYTDAFEASTRIFFQHKIHLESHPLWN